MTASDHGSYRALRLSDNCQTVLSSKRDTPYGQKDYCNVSVHAAPRLLEIKKLA
jgi:hypothetical protein